LFLLTGFVDNEGGALGFLLGDLLGFDGGGEFGGEGEMLVGLLVRWTWGDGGFWGGLRLGKRHQA